MILYCASKRSLLVWRVSELNSRYSVIDLHSLLSIFRTETLFGDSELWSSSEGAE